MKLQGTKMAHFSAYYEKKHLYCCSYIITFDLLQLFNQPFFSLYLWQTYDCLHVWSVTLTDIGTICLDRHDKTRPACIILEMIHILEFVITLFCNLRNTWGIISWKCHKTFQFIFLLKCIWNSPVLEKMHHFCGNYMEISIDTPQQIHGNDKEYPWNLWKFFKSSITVENDMADILLKFL